MDSRKLVIVATLSTSTALDHSGFGIRRKKERNSVKFKKSSALHWPDCCRCRSDNDPDS